MGHYCRICERIKPNEKFSGKGHRIHICNACTNLPKKQRNRIDHLNEIRGFWEQKNISKKNISRLVKLMESENKEVSNAAEVLHEVATRYPLKKKRVALIAQEMPNLISKLENSGFIHNWVDGDYGETIVRELRGDHELWDEYSSLEQ